MLQNKQCSNQIERGAQVGLMCHVHPYPRCSDWRPTSVDPLFCAPLLLTFKQATDATTLNSSSLLHRIMARFSAFAFLAIFTSAATAFVTPLAGAQLGRRAVSANVATTRMSAAPATAAPTVREQRYFRARETTRERQHSLAGVLFCYPSGIGKVS